MTLGRAVAWVLLTVLLGGFGAAWMIKQGQVPVPERFNPFMPLNVAAAPGPLTTWKFWQATHDPARCMAALATSGMTFDAVADTTSVNGCSVHDAVRVSRLSDAAVNQPFLASCPLALSLAMAERHAWQPAAALQHARITRIDHVGTFACRNINHASQGTLSEHAHANAIDIEAFVLSNGQRISIADDWHRDTPRGMLLKQARDGACRYFHVVLGPDYNALHHTHLHLDMGPYHTCR